MLLYIFCTIVLAVTAYFYFQLRAKNGSIMIAGHGNNKSSQSSNNGGSSSSVAQTMQNGMPNGMTDNKSGLVLFGSQTGTAEMFAKTLAREGNVLGVPLRVCNVEEYDCCQLEDERLVIVVCATYGEGEPTDSMKDFHEWLMDDLRSIGEELCRLRYTVFGLGDKQYKYFCEEGIVVDRRLAQLGATRIYGAGCGDAGCGQL
uniref:NADPH--cytochrome P450 reductase n=1 Tax=Lygus hesperus TaxID=30085 RepID=A0A0A9YGY8_LYGHE